MTDEEMARAVVDGLAEGVTCYCGRFYEFSAIAARWSAVSSAGALYFGCECRSYIVAFADGSTECGTRIERYSTHFEMWENMRAREHWPIRPLRVPRIP